MEDEMNKVEISQSLLNIYQKSKLAAYAPHSEYYAVRKEFKGKKIIITVRVNTIISSIRTQRRWSPHGIFIRSRGSDFRSERNCSTVSKPTC